jgi:hypothetical protein
MTTIKPTFHREMKFAVEIKIVKPVAKKQLKL